MGQPPKQRSADFKLKLALEAIKGEQSIAQLATQHGIHPKQIMRWRDKLLEEGVKVFKDKRSKDHDDSSTEALLKIVEQHRIELEFLKKKLLRLQ
jgi:transposase-like protein